MAADNLGEGGPVLSAYAGDIISSDAWQLLETTENAVLIDVRTKAEWQQVGELDFIKFTECSRPSRLALQKSRKRCSTGKRGGRSYSCQMKLCRRLG